MTTSMLGPTHLPAASNTNTAAATASSTRNYGRGRDGEPSTLNSLRHGHGHGDPTATPSYATHGYSATLGEVDAGTTLAEEGTAVNLDTTRTARPVFGERRDEVGDGNEIGNEGTFRLTKGLPPTYASTKRPTYPHGGDRPMKSHTDDDGKSSTMKDTTQQQQDGSMRTAARISHTVYLLVEHYFALAGADKEKNGARAQHVFQYCMRILRSHLDAAIIPDETVLAEKIKKQCEFRLLFTLLFRWSGWGRYAVSCLSHYNAMCFNG
ncbi:uncharacterized protein EV422DRAFT_206861 [Fimicolochytrium jonesii]|uniref:uncharacterized protein n=1 Tax=Fimicolochytrium jonesii TaxID=1396493 RepID=UPI0022FEF92B|nr:uncharacterized protein EV422DRAFT_206861 [Fimicolochytrium jonesii]KAI8817813.1 hypothetical protein EV422DRAFT_206861 [Fimicolochytrium jonesii]